MGQWETKGESDEWYTPAYIFDALGETFDLDVAAPHCPTHVPADETRSLGDLPAEWPDFAFVWMNPPFGGRNGLVPWLDYFFAHAHGIALTPDRTSTDWWQDAVGKADAVLFMRGKVKFERPDGSIGKSPANGTTLFASGKRAVAALRRASTLGIVMEKVR